MNELLYTEGDVRFAVATAKSEIERLTAELGQAPEIQRMLMDENKQLENNNVWQATKIAEHLDTIERLTAEIDSIKQVEFPRRLKNVASAWKGKVDALTAERDSLKEGLDGWHARYLDCEVERDAAYAAGREAMRQEWQPIETAPKDGSSYLVWAGGVGMAHYVDHYRSGYPHKAPFSENLAAWKEKATHWMPLPEKPE